METLDEKKGLPLYSYWEFKINFFDWKDKFQIGVDFSMFFLNCIYWTHYFRVSLRIFCEFDDLLDLIFPSIILLWSLKSDLKLIFFITQDNIPQILSFVHFPSFSDSHFQNWILRISIPCPKINFTVMNDSKSFHPIVLSNKNFSFYWGFLKHLFLFFTWENFRELKYEEVNVSVDMELESLYWSLKRISPYIIV